MLDKKLVAFHEAGHAVVTEALGLPVESVTAEPDSEAGTLGSSRMPDEVAGREAEAMTWDTSAMWSDLVLKAAGPVAQALEESGRPFIGAAPDIDWDDVHLGGDWEAVLDRAHGLVTPSYGLDPLLREVVAGACAVLRARWNVVQRVADALLERGTLRREDFLKLLREEEPKTLADAWRMQQRMNAQEILESIVAGDTDPRHVRVEGRERPCPVCETSAWYGPRSFDQTSPSYWLCKWCGFRWSVSEGSEEGTLALPVYHDCLGGRRLLTWHQVEPGETYLSKTWACECGETLRLCKTLRPFPGFSHRPDLIEAPGD